MSIRRRRFAWVFAFVSVAAAIAAAMPGCSSKSSGLNLAAGCSLNTDCDNPLVCIFSLCHQECAGTRDCPMGEACVETPSGYGVCELPQEANCSPTEPCAGGLVCGQDNQCRASCTTSTNCLGGQSCIDKICYDPGEIDGGGSSSSGSSSGSGSGSSSGSSSGGGSGSGSGGGSGSSSGGGSGSGSGGDSGCVAPEGDGGALAYTPSNFNPSALALADGGLLPEGGVSFANAPDVTISGTCGGNAGTAPCPSLPPAATVSLSDGTRADLIITHNFTVQSGAVLTLSGCPYPRPLIIAALGTATIQGTIDLSGQGAGEPGAGGVPPCGSAGPLGNGGGGIGYGGSYPTSAAGGGSFCGLGGTGAGTGTLAPGGSPYGNATLIPLVAGSAGGNFNPGYGYLAESAGALQISAGVSLTVSNTGTITVGGGGYNAGGASGGALLLEAPTVTIGGILAANGGGGGNYNGHGANANPSAVPAPGALISAIQSGGPGGAGGAGATINGGNGGPGDGGAASMINGAGGGGVGWIRINSACGPTIGPNAIISPSLAPATTCATTGPLP